MTITHINGRWTLDLPPHRAAREEWVDPGWERERLDSMFYELGRIAVDREPIVYDIGTEEGDLSALYASWGCQVVLVEPNPKVWPNVRWCFEHNGLSPLAWWNGFAGEQTIIPTDHIGEAYVGWSDQEWPAAAYGDLIGDHGFLNLSERPDVPVTTLDHLSDLTGHPPDAITMDVEGAELLVLRGAAGILDHVRPLVWVSIHPEFSERMYGLRRDDLLDFMRDHDYRHEMIAWDHEEHFLFRPGLPGDRPR